MELKANRKNGLGNVLSDVLFKVVGEPSCLSVHVIISEKWAIISELCTVNIVISVIPLTLFPLIFYLSTSYLFVKFF